MSVNFSFAQIITVRVNNFVEKKAALSSLSGEKISFIDSLSINHKSEIEYNLSNNHPGIYRLTLNNNPSLQSRTETSWLDFIYDTDDVEIETDANNILDSLKVIQSESNKIYYEFIKLNKEYKTKSELLQLILARYPQNDDFHRRDKKTGKS